MSPNSPDLKDVMVGLATIQEGQATVKEDIKEIKDDISAIKKAHQIHETDVALINQRCDDRGRQLHRITSEIRGLASTEASTKMDTERAKAAWRTIKIVAASVIATLMATVGLLQLIK